jgi:diguanylate cyclase (GGDEF)-like protein
MSTQDKALKYLLEMGDPSVRRTSAEQLDHALRTVLALTDGDAAVVLPPATKRGERLVLHAGSSGTAILPPPERGSELVRALAADAEPILVADLAEDGQFGETDGCPGVESGPVLFVALRQRNPEPGYLAVYRRRGRARFNPADTRSMVLVAAWLGNALEMLRLSVGAEKLSLSDDLTQVYNARFLKTALKREVKRAGRFAQELSVVLADVDQYDVWCSENGEVKGGVLLREVAALLARQVRAFDLMARFSGNQFMVVLPQTGREGALEVAERMRAAVAAHTFSSEMTGAITLSLGMASFPQGGVEVPALLASAERALARARQHGANRVEPPLDRAA